MENLQVFQKLRKDEPSWYGIRFISDTRRKLGNKWREAHET